MVLEDTGTFNSSLDPKVTILIEPFHPLFASRACGGKRLVMRSAARATGSIPGPLIVDHVLLKGKPLPPRRSLCFCLTVCDLPLCLPARDRVGSREGGRTSVGGVVLQGGASGHGRGEDSRAATGLGASGAQWKSGGREGQGQFWAHAGSRAAGSHPRVQPRPLSCLHFPLCITPA